MQGVPVSIFHLVLREQGLMVAKGNPKGIKALHDLKRPDVTFVNRQAGSGTRVLLDHRLKSIGDCSRIGARVLRMRSSHIWPWQLTS